MNVLYSNISGGLVFAGQKYGEMLFRKVSLESYIQYFKSKEIDILSLSEVHLENESSSQMVERIANELGLPHYSVQSLDASHLDTSKLMGTAIISRYPIARQERFTIPSPKLEVDRPNGEHWVMLDKGGQRVVLDVDGKAIEVVNFSYFPFHHFNRSVNESQFSSLRKNLLGILLNSNQDIPTIITGDFNNKNHSIDSAFPELFTDNYLKKAVDVASTVIGYTEQLDHILYQPQFMEAHGGFAEQNDSDHFAIGATINLK